MNDFHSAPFGRFLHRLTSHSRLAPEERQAILNLPGQRAEIRTNVDFAGNGQNGDHAWLVVDGLIGRFDQSPDGVRQITAVYIPGDMAGLSTVIAPETGVALQALSVVTMMRVPRAALWASARRHPAVAEAYWRECVLDAAVLGQWTVNVGRRSAQSRMAHLICELGCRYSAAGLADHAAFPFPATQNHIADMLGLTAVHVNRTLMGLRAENVVTIQSRQARVHDWSRLAEIGDFDPAYLQIGASVGEPACVAVAS
jgi:CRP-like cAMP-binding protein